MLKRIAAVVAVLAICVSTSFAGAGKIKWNSDCTSDKRFDLLSAECKATGQPMMILFCSDMCPVCQQLSSGALSDEKVVKASEKFVRVLADNGKLANVSKKYNIKSIPVMVYIDSEGKEVGRMTDTSAAGLEKQMTEIADKFTRAPKWAESQEKGLEAAKTGEKPEIIFYTDDSAKSQAIEKSFSDLAVADFYEKLSWVKVTISLKSDEAKKLGLTALPAMWIVDARAEDPMAKPMKKIALPRAAAGLKTDFTDVLKAYKSTETDKK